MINLNNFVTINIDYDSAISANGSRPVVVLLDDLTTVNTQVLAKASYHWTSLNDFTTALSNDKPEINQLYKMVATYFENGGKEIHYIKYTENEGINTTIEKIKSLPTNEILIAACFNDREKLINVAAKINTEMTGINEKFFLISKAKPESKETITDETKFDDYPNMAIKIGDAGIEMTIAAYLSKIDIDTGNIQDYCFTNEYLGSFINDSTTPVIDDNDIFAKLKEISRYNMNIKLVQDTNNYARNYGGNTAAKQDLVNYYVKIILIQTLSEALFSLLKTKIKYSQSSIALISATITDELNRYKRAGYLSTDKIWTNGDQYDASGNYLILSNNTPLTRGYTFSILPLESLTNTDKAEHKLPPIYVFLADTYSIRQISLTGKLF